LKRSEKAAFDAKTAAFSLDLYRKTAVFAPIKADPAKAVQPRILYPYFVMKKAAFAAKQPFLTLKYIKK